MTPKEKAIELVDKFTIPYYQWDGDGYNIDWEETFKNRKQCALIAVDELIYLGNTELLSEIFEGDYYCDVDFFEAVKKEIENL